MQKKIIKQLRQLEQEHDIHIFYAVESGSRAWGFASNDSDYDVRFLYYHIPEWYFSVSPQQDNITRMEENGLLDFAGWELKKTLTLLLKSNMSLYEWLKSPIVYLKTDDHNQFAKTAEQFFTPKALIFSYTHLAEGNYKNYINKEFVKIKKYLYVLRTIAACRWIERTGTLPPIEIDKLKDILREENHIFVFLERLIQDKKNNVELGVTAPDKEINAWIANQLSYYKSYADALPALNKKTEILNRFFYQTVNKLNLK